MVSFAKNLQEVLADAKVTRLVSKAQNVYALHGVTDSSDKSAASTKSKVDSTREVLGELTGCLRESQSRIETFLQSMVRFSYLSQRVFIHLIYQGFCG